MPLPKPIDSKCKNAENSNSKHEYIPAFVGSKRGRPRKIKKVEEEIEILKFNDPEERVIDDDDELDVPAPKEMLMDIPGFLDDYIGGKNLDAKK